MVFGVAAALDVGDAVVVPAVLVVADQGAVRVGGEGRFARSGEAEEERDVAIGALVCGAVHREHAAFGHQVVHDGEDALLHLAGVLAAEDDELAGAEVEHDAGGVVHALDGGVGGAEAGVVDGVVGVPVGGQFVFSGADEHVPHEEGVVGSRADDPHLDLRLGVPAGVAVDDVELVALVKIIKGDLLVLLERRLGDGDVDVAPPDVVVACGLVDDPLVFRAAALLFGGIGEDGPRGDDLPSVVHHGLLVQHGRREVALHVRDGDTKGRKIDVETHA